jgi:hypothetical protein
VTPIDPRTSERHLLTEALRWTRSNGWVPRWPESRHTGQWTWANAEWPRMRPPLHAVRVVFDGRDVQVTKFNGADGWYATATVRVASVVHAVDVLVALGILPAWLSSSWAAAEDRYREQVETQADEIERLNQHVAHLLKNGSPGVMHEVDKSFYDLAVKERDYHRQRADRYMRDRLALQRERDDARNRLQAVRKLKVWTNEDGKDFVFANDLWHATDPETNPKSGDAA